MAIQRAQLLEAFEMEQLLVLLRTMVYRLWYQHILRRCQFGPGVRFYGSFRCIGPGKVVVGGHVFFMRDFWQARPVIITTHSKHARVWIGEHAVLRGTAIGCLHQIVIEHAVCLEDAHVIDTDFHAVDPEQRFVASAAQVSPVVIRSGSYVGTAAIVMKGVELGRGSQLLSGSCIRMKSIPEQRCVLGFPPRMQPSRIMPLQRSNHSCNTL